MRACIVHLKFSLNVPLAFAVRALVTSERSHPKARSAEAKEEVGTGKRGATRRRVKHYDDFLYHDTDYSQAIVNENPKIAQVVQVLGAAMLRNVLARIV